MNIVSNSKHYVPILRWKAAEKEALEPLSAKDKQFMTPLLEILMPQPRTLKEGDHIKTPKQLLDESLEMLRVALPKVPGEILKCWGSKPAFVDFGLVDISLRAQGLEQVITAGERAGIQLVPVVILSSDAETLKVAFALAKNGRRGLCLRLLRSDFASAQARTKIEAFLKTSGLPKESIDLLVDLKNADEQCSNLTGICDQIPELLKWRSFIVASGAFPPDLTDLSVDLHFIPRSDWNAWFSEGKKPLLRKPCFADYTIQHPIYREPTRGSNPSASIRYTLNDQWMIMRGQALRGKNTKGHAQYPAVARIIAARPEFFGADFSFGDAYIAEKAKNLKAKETGTPRTWLRAGINHHLACTIAQIARLP